MPERNSVTLLHPSDTQFGRNHRFGDLPVNTLAERLLRDLATLRKDRAIEPEIVVVSGDLAEWGRKKEFDEALQLLTHLSENLEVPRNHIVIVPGNHDINRQTCLSCFAECAGDDKQPVKPYWPKWRHFASMFRRLLSR